MNFVWSIPAFRQLAEILSARRVVSMFQTSFVYIVAHPELPMTHFTPPGSNNPPLPYG